MATLPESQLKTTTTTEVTLEHSSQETDKTDESLQRHRDSASTLGFASSASGTERPPVVVEMQSSGLGDSEPAGTTAGVAPTTVIAVSSPLEGPPTGKAAGGATNHSLEVSVL